MMEMELTTVFVSFFCLARVFSFTPPPPPPPFFIKNNKTLPRVLQSISSIKEDCYQDPYEKLLREMTRFFGQDMVDPVRQRFYYYCFPFDGECEHVHFPIRDLAAAWDATKALEFSYSVEEVAIDLSEIQQQLCNAIKCTIYEYRSSLIEINDEKHGLCLNKDSLLEPSNIGHSGLMLLGACNAIRFDVLEAKEMQEMVKGLTQGILSMQLDNGSFAIEFGNSDFLRGIEFFPGEAILALMDVYDLSDAGILSKPLLIEESTRKTIQLVTERAFEFYSNHYRTADVGINYNIWQAMAFAKLYDKLPNSSRRKEVAKYVVDLCQEICQSRSWKYQLARGKSFYINLETVEIACGLDAISEGIRVANLEGKDSTDTVKLFQMHASNAVEFLHWAQQQVPSSCTVGRGGLGYGGVQVLEQRLDVTGHAISALTKLRKLSSLELQIARN